MAILIAAGLTCAGAKAKDGAMAEAHPHPDPVALMAREARVRLAPLTAHFAGVNVGEGKHLLRGNGILLNAPSGIRILYRKGEGVTVSRPENADLAEESLWLNGTIYAAIASINGLYPIHASAVAADGRVFAFTGPGGAGKSTLVAELGRRGLPMFCDDTLILDISDPDRIMCLPGHKRLKLWPDALALTGAEQQEEIVRDWGKYYAAPPGGTVTEMLPLAELCFLEEGEPPRFEEVSGGQRLTRLMDDHYTADLYLEAQRPDAGARFQLLGQLARAMDMTRFVRPRDAARFGETAALAESHVRNAAAQG